MAKDRTGSSRFTQVYPMFSLVRSCFVVSYTVYQRILTNMFIQCYAHMIYIYPSPVGFPNILPHHFLHRSIADWFELTQSISHFQITWGSSSHFVCCQVELVSPYHFHRETLSSWKIWLGLSISLRWRRSRSNSYLLTTGMHCNASSILPSNAVPEIRDATPAKPEVHHFQAEMHRVWTKIKTHTMWGPPVMWTLVHTNSPQ